jgi:hypothetical protein
MPLSSNDDRVAVDEALDILADVLEWRTTAAGWHATTRLLDELTDAHTAGDYASLRVTTSILENSSPNRTTPIGGEPTGPPPAPTRDRLNRLIHSLEQDVGSTEDDGTRSE